MAIKTGITWCGCHLSFPWSYALFTGNMATGMAHKNGIQLIALHVCYVTLRDWCRPRK